MVFPVVMEDLHPRAERRPPPSFFLGEPLRHLEGGEELSCLARDWCGRWTHSPDLGAVAFFYHLIGDRGRRIEL